MNSTISRLFAAILGLTLVSNVAISQDEESTANYRLTLSPVISYATVSGNESLFREHTWRDDGFIGGLQSAVLYDNSDAIAGDLRLEGRFIAGNGDYEIQGEWVSPDGNIFVNAGFEQFRKYYDNTGWYYEGIEDAYQRATTFDMDIGRLYFDLGFKPQDNTTIVLGYEYQYKDGTKSLRQYQQLDDNKKIYPTYKDIDEDVHIFKLDIAHQGSDWALQDSMRYEIYSSDTFRNLMIPAEVVGGTDPIGQTFEEGYDFDQFSNALTAEKWLRDWLLISGGYLYVRTEGEVGFEMRQLPFTGSHAHNDYMIDSDLTQTSHVFNLAAMAGPWNDFMISGGVELELGNRDDSSEVMHVSPSSSQPVSIDAYERKVSLKEELELSYSGVPHTKMYVRGTWVQTSYDLDELEYESDTGTVDLDRDTDTDRDEQRYRAGFTTSPFSSMSLSAWYQYGEVSNIYTHDVDTASGYSAFMDSLDTNAHELMVSLTLQHTNWLRSYWRYTMVKQDYYTETSDIGPADRVHGANVDSNNYTVGATVMPSARLFFNGQFTWHESRTILDSLENPMAATWDGDVYSFLTSVNYAITDKTSVDARYLYEVANNDQEELADAGGLEKAVAYDRHGASVGLTHQFTDNLSGRVAYDYWHYNDENYGETGQYTAHAITLGLTMQF